MIDGNVKEFVDSLYDATEKEYLFRGRHQMIQGYFKDGVWTYYIQQFNPDADGLIWECSAKTVKECVEEFLKAKIFEGKTFYEAEKEITWVG